MDKFIFTILLAIFSNGAMAEWTLSSESIGGSTYIDIASISKSGNVAKMWTLKNFKSIQKGNIGTYLSTVSYREFDCEKKMENTLSITAYSESMMGGKTIENEQYNDKDWIYVIPESVSETSWKIACGKK